MVNNYTSHLLIKFLYGEAFVTDIFEIEDALQHDDRIAEELKTLTASKTSLPGVSFAPSATTIANILTYSNSPATQLSLD